MSNGEHEIRTRRDCGLEIAVSLMGKICFRSSVEAVKITFLLNLWWSAFTACPWRVSSLSQRRISEKDAWSRILHRTLRVQRWKFRRHLVSRPAPSDVLWVYNIISVCLERYRSNMWYWPEQNERKRRRSAPASSSSCSGLFCFSKNIFKTVFQNAPADSY